jgi:hypothetical protein
VLCFPCSGVPNRIVLNAELYSDKRLHRNPNNLVSEQTFTIENLKISLLALNVHHERSEAILLFY